MSDDIVRAAKAEEARLLRELENTELYRKLTSVRNLLEIYDPARQGAGAPTFHAGGSARAAASGSSSSVVAVLRRFREGSRSAEITGLAKEYLKMKGSRAQTGEIVNWMRTRNPSLDLSEVNAVNLVSSYLSTSDLFDNIRGEGYGLVEWSQKPTGQEPTKETAASKLLEGLQVLKESGVD